MIKRRGKWVFLAAVAVVLIAQPVFAQNRIIDLGTLGGTWGQAYLINNLGQVAGISTTASGQRHGFFWTSEGGMVDLGTLGNGECSWPHDMNNSGQVVGERTTLPGDPLENPTLWDTTRAFLWTAEGGMVDIGTLGGTWSRASAINDLGQVAGGSKTASGEYHAFLWTAEGGMLDIGTLGGTWGDAWCINNQGQVVG
ncbi:MAG: HAF repeat-containing protein, partial [Deltaproteobacteria bacterium]|nr:HAF repeat-containing protein [Deltaproteobacteria bacterium]